jgi:LuxR family maltose regulon positive regulatory protein
MTMTGDGPVILVTKFHRPAPPPDAIPRSRLIERLELGSTLPATLISAPAGYGKTVLVSQWLAVSETRSTWLQLDANDGDPGVFLEHLVAAVRSVEPDALADTAALVAAPNLAPLSVLARTLTNELEALAAPIILVLDDYHSVPSGDVDELLSEILEHPPGQVHLVLISRMDPRLPLARLRGRGDISEVRAHDLRLTRAETAAFIAAATGASPDSETTRALDEHTEGWIAGLRLAIQAVRATGNQLSSVAGIGPLDGATRDFLVAEVLEAQPPEIREYMLASSAPSRFSALLCEALVGDGDGPDAERVSGQDFIDWVVRQRLLRRAARCRGYVVPLPPPLQGTPSPSSAAASGGNPAPRVAPAGRGPVLGRGHGRGSAPSPAGSRGDRRSSGARRGTRPRRLR